MYAFGLTCVFISVALMALFGYGAYRSYRTGEEWKEQSDRWRDAHRDEVVKRRAAEEDARQARYAVGVPFTTPRTPYLQAAPAFFDETDGQ